MEVRRSARFLRRMHVVLRLGTSPYAGLRLTQEPVLLAVKLEGQFK